MNNDFHLLRTRGLRAGLLVAALGALGACASHPAAPESSLAAARTAIQSAERADAGHYAAGELTEARAEMASADSAVAARRMVQAERLADQARVEADLATARTGQIKSSTVNADMRRSNSTLVEEIRRGEETK